MGEKSILDEILKQIYHPNIDVRELALRDMEYICNEENKEKIIRCMKKALKDSSKSVASTAEECLNRILEEENEG